MSDRPTGSTAFIIENTALRAEVERLRAIRDGCERMLQERADEIERLRADPDPGQRIWDDGYAAGKAASAMENERLRALVSEAARLLEGQSAPASADRLRAALEPPSQ